MLISFLELPTERKTHPCILLASLFFVLYVCLVHVCSSTTSVHNTFTYGILQPLYISTTYNYTRRIIQTFSFSSFLVPQRNQNLTQPIQSLITGDTAVYLMFAFARVASILRKVNYLESWYEIVFVMMYCIQLYSCPYRTYKSVRANAHILSLGWH